MSRIIIGKMTLYYGSGQAAEERGARMDAGAKRRGFVNKDGVPELSPLLVYCFELVDSLSPAIEAEARKLQQEPGEFINTLFQDYKKKKPA